MGTASLTRPKGKPEAKASAAIQLRRTLSGAAKLLGRSSRVVSSAPHREQKHEHAEQNGDEAEIAESIEADSGIGCGGRSWFNSLWSAGLARRSGLGKLIRSGSLRPPRRRASGRPSPSNRAVMTVMLSGPPRSFARSISAEQRACGSVLSGPARRTLPAGPARRVHRSIGSECHPADRLIGEIHLHPGSGPRACRMMFLRSLCSASSSVSSPASTRRCIRLWSLVSWIASLPRTR